MINTAELRRMAEAATERPWEPIIPRASYADVAAGFNLEATSELDKARNDINAAFTSAACNSIIPLLDELERKTKALEFVWDHIRDPARGPRDLYPAFGLDVSEAIEFVREALEAK